MKPVNPRRIGWRLAGMVGLPLLTMTAYLLWMWPRPGGTSLVAEAGPYVLCLLTGLPAALGAAHGPRRIALIFGFLVVGFAVLWIYAVIVLCGVRNVCL